MRAELCKDENRHHDSIWAAEAGAAVLCRGCGTVWLAQTARGQLACVADTELGGGGQIKTAGVYYHKHV